MGSDGILLLDKGFGLSSHEAVRAVRNLLGYKKAGHAGTLDPSATGLLILTLGKATKISGYLSFEEKQYCARIRLGQSRDTFDRYGRIISQHEVNIQRDELERALDFYRGDFHQIIPPFSAANFEGKRFYDLARRGDEVPIRYRTVRIKQLDLLDFSDGFLSIKIRCQSGTYIRSLAHQLGEKLGCGAHLFSLRRMTIGQFDVDHAVTLQQLTALKRLGRVESAIIPVGSALNIPALIINEEKIGNIRNGQDVLAEDIMNLETPFNPGDLVGIKTTQGELLAIGEAKIGSDMLVGKTLSREKVFEYKRVI